MNAKYRPVLLFVGFSGLVLLLFYVLSNLPAFNPEKVLIISVPDMIVFFLAYRTYPVEDEVKRGQRIPVKI